MIKFSKPVLATANNAMTVNRREGNFGAEWLITSNRGAGLSASRWAGITDVATHTTTMYAAPAATRDVTIAAGSVFSGALTSSATFTMSSNPMNE